MVQRKWILGVASVLLVLLVVTGFAVVAAEVGSQGDPLLTFSYITEELMPSVMVKLDEAIAAKTASIGDTMNEKFAQYNQQLDAKIADFETRNASTIINDELINQITEAVVQKLSAQSQSSDVYKVVDVEKGKTLTGVVGTELLLRIGSATSVAEGTPLIDITTGGELAGGKVLEKNHLYIVTVDGRGLKATADVKVVVRGEYTIK